MLTEVKRVRLDVPGTNVETNIVVYQIEEGGPNGKFVALIYRRGGADIDWSFAGRTIETYSAERAEGFARTWHSQNLRSKIAREAPIVGVPAS